MQRLIITYRIEIVGVDDDSVPGSVQNDVFDALVDTMTCLKGLGQAAIMLSVSLDGMFNY